jgi:hypothetical protein
MKFLKSLLMGTGAVVLAGSVLALFVPKAVHAIAATAVQVVNTSASPVVTGELSQQASQIVTVYCILEPGLTPPQSCFQVLPNGRFLQSSYGPNGGYLVPPTQYFVLKSIDTNLVGGPNTYNIGLPDIGLPADPVIPFEQILLQPNGQVSFSSGIVFGPGQEIILSPNNPQYGNLYLHGYLTAN